MDVPAFLERIRCDAERAGLALEQWGLTYDQFPLVTLRNEWLPGRPSIYLSAGIHGDEPAGCLAVGELLEERFFDIGANWQIFPMLNPEGCACGARGTRHGIDMNRDYLARASLEVQSHVRWLEHQPLPDLVLSLHEDWETAGFYLYEINTGPSPSISPDILAAVATLLPLECGCEVDGHTLTEPGLIRHRPEADEPGNWPEAIHLVNRGPHLSCTFETPSQLPLAIRVAAQKTAVRAAVASFFEISAIKI